MLEFIILSTRNNRHFEIRLNASIEAYLLRLNVSCLHSSGRAYPTQFYIPLFPKVASVRNTCKKLSLRI